MTHENPGSGIFECSDRATEAVADADPLTATYAGISGRDDRWPDLTPAGHAQRAELMESLRRDALSCRLDGPDEELAARVLIEDLDEHLERYAAGDHHRDLNSIASSFQSLHDVFGVMSDPAAVAARLSTLHEALRGWRETMAEGLTSGIVVARRQVETTIEQGRAWSGSEGFAEVASLDGCREPALAARAAYAEAADWLERDYLPYAEAEDAVGEGRYMREARSHLGTTIDASDTYAWGWSEVRRVQNELARVCDEIAPGDPMGAAIELLRTDPARAAGDSAEFLDLMLQRQLTALDQLAGKHFVVDDRIRSIEVSAAPPGGPLAPHYTPPSEDFSRPGCVWYPLGDRSTFPLWEEVTTAHHEGFPGHHLQVGTQMALGERSSRYHRTLVWKPGSGEGWALYAEALMGELGYLDRPEYVAGQLAAELFRACRIVIDIGLHLRYRIPEDAPFHAGERWSPELALTVLRDEAFVEEGLAASEVTRYLGWPAQAISYKLGERAITELRSQRQTQGDFDPSTFHADVLRVGAVGLDLLRDSVNPGRWRAGP